jgi:hypothetical protein
MAVLVLFLLALRSTVGLEHGMPLTGEEAEQFLRTATVVEMRPLKVGITGPKQALLSDGKRSLRAAWKTVDQHRRGFTELEDGRKEFNFTDSYKYEIAAIDHSRAFRTQRQLLAEKHLERFSRPVLEKLSALDRSVLQAKLDPWLTSQQVEALWARRQRILDLADQLVAERGEGRVLYP